MTVIQRFRVWVAWKHWRLRHLPALFNYGNTWCYFRWLRARWEVRAWLHFGNADAIAAHCLWGLNRHARTGSGKSIIYPLKSEVLRILCRKGPLEKLAMQTQTLKCWHTLEYDDGEEDICRKCGNTGIYRQHTLYRFTFKIGSRRYTWHQPQDLVTWLSELPGVGELQPEGEYKLVSEEGHALLPAFTWLYTAAVYEYVKMHGGQAKEPKTLMQSLWSDWWASGLYQSLHHWKLRLRWNLQQRKRRAMKVVDADQQIPF